MARKKRKPVSARTREKISRGLDQFWDKKGRKKEDKELNSRNVGLALAGLGGVAALGGGAYYANKKGAFKAVGTFVKKGSQSTKNRLAKPISKIQMDDGSVVDISKAPDTVGRKPIERSYEQKQPKSKEGKKIKRPELDDNLNRRFDPGQVVDEETRIVDPTALGDARASTTSRQQSTTKSGASSQTPKNSKATPKDNKRERIVEIQRSQYQQPKTKRERDARRRGILQSEEVREARRELQAAKEKSWPEKTIERLHGKVESKKRQRRARYDKAQRLGTWFNQGRLESIIEFNRKRRQDQKTRQKISRGLENFWNKKGRKSKKKMSNVTKVALAAGGLGVLGGSAVLLNKANKMNKGLAQQGIPMGAPKSRGETPIATVGTKEQASVVAQEVSQTVLPKPRKKPEGKQLNLFDTKPYKTKRGKRGPKSGNIVDNPPKRITPTAPKPSSDRARQLNLLRKGRDY